MVAHWLLNDWNLQRAKGWQGRKTMLALVLNYIARRYAMAIAALLIPPVGIGTIAIILQLSHMPEPWASAIQSSAFGVMVYIFWKLANRLLDEAKTRQETFEKLLEKNTAAITSATLAMDKSNVAVSELHRASIEAIQQVIAQHGGIHKRR